MRRIIHFWKVVLILVFLIVSDFTTAKATYNRDDLEECENTVKNWASSSQEFEVFEHQKILKDLLFFLHVPRTGGKNYFHCILEQLYDTSSRCPHSYDRLRFDPRNPRCNLTVTHDDYSLMSKLPKDQTSVVTIIRNPIDRVISSYEFAVEVAARSLQYNSLTSAIQVGDDKPNDTERGATQDIWPWSYLVPWMIRDLFSRRDQRKLNGETVIISNDPYNMEEILMPLHQFINEAMALDLVHNGATFQVAGLTNNSCSKMSHRVRHCVIKYPSLGDYVLGVAKRRLDNMLYVGLTDKHKESATLFANVVGDQVMSKLAQSRLSRNSSAIKRPEHAYAFRNSSSKTVVEKAFVKPYESCIKRLLASQTRRRNVAMDFIAPANFTKETRHRISKRIIEEITALNNLDIQLYEYAQLIFEKQKQVRSQKAMTIVIGDGMLKTIYVASWKPLLFAFPFLILILFIFIYVNGRKRRSKSKV